MERIRVKGLAQFAGAFLLLFLTLSGPARADEAGGVLSGTDACPPVFEKKPKKEKNLRVTDASRVQINRFYRSWNAKYYAVFMNVIAPEVREFERANKFVQLAHLERVSDAVGSKIEGAYGVSSFGMHFNLNGGSPLDYITGGGVFAGKGSNDTVVNFKSGSVPLDQLATDPEVYFYRSEATTLFEALNRGNSRLGPLWNAILKNTRMGNVLVLFSLDSAEWKAEKESGELISATSNSMSFDERKVARSSNSQLIGIKSSKFLLPPIPLYGYDVAALGIRRLSRNANTLIALRQIEFWVQLFLNGQN